MAVYSGSQDFHPNTESDIEHPPAKSLAGLPLELERAIRTYHLGYVANWQQG
ncbi:hypothetical protein ACVRXQ_02700 [Streptococcus panodentis]|uniref:hypothetical protein n=1 Tax=Streptococcus panodentis TaxID=1581472 RepID=UPI001AEB926C|nr:hypothetical protein [Streptococcus panodentis]